MVVPPLAAGGNVVPQGAVVGERGFRPRNRVSPLTASLSIEGVAAWHPGHRAATATLAGVDERLYPQGGQSGGLEHCLE
jgi:hypothetical protein